MKKETKTIYHPSQHSLLTNTNGKKQGARHALGSGKKPRNRKRCWFGTQLPGRVPRGLRGLHPPTGASAPRCFSASRSNRGSDGCKEVIGRKEYGLGDWGAKAPDPWRWEGSGFKCAVSSSLGHVLPSVCPSLALLQPEGYEFGAQKAPAGCWMAPCGCVAVCRRRWVDGRAEDPALPPKGRRGSKMLWWKKKSRTLPALTLTRPSLLESSAVPDSSITLWKYLNLFLTKHLNVIS